MRGRKPKPTHLKVIAGTDRNDRKREGGTALPTVEGTPEPPDWLPGVHAVTEWRRLAPILIANGLLTEAGLSPLAMLCALHGEIAAAFAAGLTPKSGHIRQYHGLCSDFGLTPASAARVRPNPPKKDNPFQRHKRPEAPK